MNEDISTNTNNAGEDLLLDAKGLVKAYKGRRVVTSVNINVKPGEVVGLLGPNGMAVHSAIITAYNICPRFLCTSQ